MKGLNLKKLVAMALTLATVTAVSPVAASAAWKQDAKGWWNTEGNSWSIGWRQIDGTWYHFDETGYMSTGWVIDYSAGYGQWYFMDQSGAMKTGWMQDAGKWYFLQPSGAMKTGWINDAGTWYFAEASGSMLTGVIKVDGQTYYLQSNGAMATGEVEINGTKYTFAANGACVGDAPKADKVFGTTDSGNNSGSSNTDKDTDSDSSSSSSGGGGGSSHGSSTPQAIKDYSSSANITVVSSSEATDDKDTYTVTFNNKDFNAIKAGDYAVRDLYVTNEDAKVDYKESEKAYYVTVKKGEKLDIKGVTRVVRNGIIYYANGTTTNK